ncbi:MAG TPA: AMP-binding protein, partial [Flavisolibacter sp.]
MEQVENHIIGHLARHSSASPGKPAFIFLEDGEQLERTITFGELNTRVERLGSVLAERQPQGQRALLVYQDIMEFTVSFLACQHAGLVAVPVFLSKGSKQVARFINLMEDAGVSLILSTSDLEAQVQQVLSGYLQTSGIELIATEAIQAGEAGSPRGNSKSEIAFIQYTSGSTGRPKGVVVTRGNLMHNEWLIQDTFGCDSSSVIFSWLPFHHDMGLIGNILHTIYVGCTCVLMSPYHFMQKPRRWLEGITKYKATHSGGPNFAYDFCLGKIPPAELEGLDLSSWKVAYNGSEPVRAETIRRFSRYFEKVGFGQNTFFPCYGLAEATLLVSGGKEDKAPAILYIEKDTQS